MAQEIKNYFSSIGRDIIFESQEKAYQYAREMSTKNVHCYCVRELSVSSQFGVLPILTIYPMFQIARFECGKLIWEK